MSNFAKAFDYCMDNEGGDRPDGGYTDDPDDPGGETKYGIAKRYHPNVDIKALSKEQAMAIAEQEYWKKYKCDQIDNDAIATKLFDTVFSMGGVGVWMLQQALREVWPLCCGLDGKMGPETLGVLNNRVKTDNDVYAVLSRYCGEIREYRYQHSKAKYLSGHVRRAVMIPEVGNGDNRNRVVGAIQDFIDRHRDQ